MNRKPPLSQTRYKAGKSVRAKEFRSLIDLGTASVKALVIEVGLKQTHVWGHGQSSLEGSYAPDGRIVDREALVAACDAALSAAEEMTRHTFGHKIVPDRSVWSVPAWLCQGRSVTLEHRRPQPQRRISRREWLALQARLEDAVGHLSGKPVDIVRAARVENHNVTDATGLRGEMLALQAFVVSTDANLLTTLQKVAAALELDPPTFVSQARATAAGSPGDGVILDVGRWGTGVVVTRLARLAGMAWVSLGGQSLYRTLANGFGLAPAQLPSFCQAYVTDQLSPEAMAAANAALVDPVARWLDLVAEQLATLAAETSLPHHIYLAGGASHLPAMLQEARRYPWMRRLSWPRHPRVYLWQAPTLRGLTDHSRRVWDASDLVRLGLARLATSLI